MFMPCVPSVLKAAKSAALISDMEREWNAGVRVGALALPNGELPGLMKVNQLPDGCCVEESLHIHAGCGHPAVATLATV
jgi:hypothetical protein